MASNKQTGQGGTSFEDKVVASYFVYMLSETYPFQPPIGLITKIKLQAHQDNWLFDDIVLEVHNGTDLRNIGVSVKSNRQFTANGCPADLNELIWMQFLKKENNPFNPERDFLCLVHTSLSEKISTDLNTLLSHAENIDAVTLYNRMVNLKSFSKPLQKMFSSFFCPQGLSMEYSVSNDYTGELLKRVLHRRSDFDTSVSNDEKNCIDLCKSLLKDGDPIIAQKLFVRLTQLPRILSPNGGMVDRKTLINLLRHEFDFRQQLSHESDWRKIKERIDERFSIIYDTLGDDLHIDRYDCVRDLNQTIEEYKVTILYGISGGGKTNVIKQIADVKRKKFPVIWLDGEDCNSSSIASSWQLKNGLGELINSVAGAEAYLFIDSAEKLLLLSDRKSVEIIIKKAFEERGVWRIVFTCVIEQLDGLISLLASFKILGSLIGKYEMPSVSPEQLIEIAKKHQSLESLFFSDSLEKVWNNLKLLDKIINNAEAAISLTGSSHLGESHLIDFVWDVEIEKTSSGLQKSSFLKHLAEKQADDLQFGVSARGYNSFELIPADILKDAGFLRIDGGKLYFNHDQYGDWARYRLLKECGSDLVLFLKKKHLTSPLWAKSLRLYAISLLENSSDNDAWQKVYSLFDELTGQHILIRDLLLEAFIFAPNCLSLLKKHKTFIFANELAIFKKILKLFLNRATSANSIILKVAAESGMYASSAVTWERVPVIQYWSDFLIFIASEADYFLEKRLIGIVQVAVKWLKYTPAYFHYRKEAADITLTAAKRILILSLQGVFIDEAIEVLVYEGLLLGYDYYPDEVAKLCLQIAKRIENPIPEVSKHNKPATSFSKRRGGRGSLDKFVNWENGPRGRVPAGFRKICVEGKALLPILRLNPPLASEILLACIISWYDRNNGVYDPLEVYYFIEDPAGWYPPFYLRGPFLAFFLNSPDSALNFCCKLIDFATDRWCAAVPNKEKKIHYKISIKEEVRVYNGDDQVLGWHKGLGNAPHVVMSLLMAAEEFFFQSVQKNVSVEKYVDALIKESNSMATVGLLITVAKMQKPLFIKLVPFLALYDIFDWDRYNTSSNNFIKGWGNEWKIWEVEIAYWFNRPYRNENLSRLIRHLIFTDSNFDSAFSGVHNYWRKEIERIKVEGHVDFFFLQLFHFTNKENNRIIVKDGVETNDYQEPDELVFFQEREWESVNKNAKKFEHPFIFNRSMKSRAGTPLEQTENLWQLFQDLISNIDLESTKHCDGQNGWFSPYTNLLDVVSMLLDHKDAWLDEHAEYLASVLQLVNGLIEKQFAWPQKFHHYTAGESWSNRLATIVAILWCDDPENLFLRRNAAGIILLFNNDTVLNFLVGCRSKMRWDNPALIQLHNLLVIYACEYHQLDRFGQYNGEELIGLHEKLASKFVKGEISNKPIIWKDIQVVPKHNNPYLREDYFDRSTSLKDPGICLHLLQPLVRTTPDLWNCEQEGEKKYITFLFEQYWFVILFQFGQISSNRKPIESLGSEFEKIVIDKIAASILALEPPVQIKFWKTLLPFGFIAQHWITGFCRAFYCNLDYPERYDSMIALQQEMVAYSKKIINWKFRPVRNYEDFRLSLLGLDVLQIRIWKNDFTAFTSKNIELYKDWFAKNKYNPFSIKALLVFMNTISGAFMLHSGVPILESFFTKMLKDSQTEPPEGKVWVGDKDLDDKLADSLMVLWKEKSGEIRNTENTFRCYRELIQYLIAMNHVIGLELQESLVSS